MNQQLNYFEKSSQSLLKQTFRLTVNSTVWIFGAGSKQRENIIKPTRVRTYLCN